MYRFFKCVGTTAVLVMALAAASSGQSPAEMKSAASKLPPNGASASPAFAELLLRKTELQSEVESLALEYTEEFPKMKEIRHVLVLVDRDIARLAKVKLTESSRLTLALGKLIVRRIELETDVWNLQRSYKDEHPDVKRAKRKVEIYEGAISEILN